MRQLTYKIWRQSIARRLRTTSSSFDTPVANIYTILISLYSRSQNRDFSQGKNLFADRKTLPSGDDVPPSATFTNSSFCQNPTIHPPLTGSFSFYYCRLSLISVNYQRHNRLLGRKRCIALITLRFGIVLPTLESLWSWILSNRYLRIGQSFFGGKSFSSDLKAIVVVRVTYHKNFDSMGIVALPIMPNSFYQSHCKNWARKLINQFDNLFSILLLTIVGTMDLKCNISIFRCPSWRYGSILDAGG